MVAKSKTGFRVLGPLTVERDGKAIPLPGGKASAALAALMLEAPRAVTTARLAEALWGEHPPPSARNALQVHLSGVRRALRDGSVHEQIAWRGDAYALEIEPEQLDLRRLDELRREARAAAVAGDMDRAASSLRQALELWRGDALEGIRGDHLAEDARRLDEIRLATLEERIDAELACGRTFDVLDELDRLVAEHPLRERLRRLLMLALYRAERQADALAVYRDARRRLTQELGIEPSPQLQELERRILRQDPSLRLSSPLILTEPGDARRRRLITALACDFRLSDVEDPEAWEQLVAPAVAAARGVLERDGGTVESAFGSSIVALFGVRSTLEHHAARAAQAALACREAVESAAAGVVELRMAVESGLALAGAAAETGRVVLGAVPGDAVRLAQAARPGEIVVGERTREIAGDTLAVESPSSEGAAKLVAVVDAGVPAASRASRFVGRRKELAALTRLYEATVSTSTPALVTVAGPPGIGKTRLAVELVRRSGVRSARGRCPEDGAHRTFWPLREALDELGLLDESRIAEALGNDAGSERTARVVAEALGIADPRLGGDERLIAFTAFFDALAREEPLVLVFDDLQWAEPAFLDLIVELTGRCSGPVFLLCLARLDFAAAAPSEWSGTTLELAPLSERECRRLAVGALGQGAHTEQLAHIVAAAEGNPLFTEELAAVVQLKRGDSDAELPLPQAIESVLAERLERLTPLEREAVERAAVEGQTFHLEGVADLCRDDRERVRETLHSLVRKDFLRPTRPPLPGHEAYRFRHVLIRDAAYASLPKLVRAELHERWADWLDGELNGELAGWESVAGSHLAASYRIQRELVPGRDVSALGERAGELFAAAALRAEANEDFDAAVTLFGRALSHLPTDFPSRVELAWRAMMLLVTMGRLEQALAWWTARTEELAQSGSFDEASVMQLGHLTALTFAGIESPSALAAGMRRGGRAVRRTRSHYLAATYEASLGWGHYQRCEIERFMARFERAHEHAVRGGDRRQQAICLAWIASGLVRGPCPAPEAITRCEEMIRDTDVPRTLETQVMLALAELHAMRGRRTAAREFLDRSLDIMRGLQLEWIAARLCSHVATVELLVGDREAARSRLAGGHEQLVAMGAPAHGALVVARLAALAASEGDADEALELAATSRAMALPDEGLAHIEASAAAAQAHALRGEFERSRKLARDAVRRALRTDEPVVRGTALTALSDAYLAAGEQDDAADALEAALGEYEAKGHLVRARQARRRLAALR